MFEASFLGIKIKGRGMRVSPQISTLVAYKAGKPIAETQREYGVSKVIKLASNENPLGTSPKVIEALKKAASEVHRYPDPSCFELIDVIHKKWSLPKNRIAIGNGSNEIIDLLIRIFCEPTEKILTTQSAFVAYQICAQAARVETIFAPMKSGFQTDLKAFSDILKKDTTKKIRLIFLPNPNNPTGTYIKDQEVQEFLKEFGNDPERLIIFDEAYTEYVRAKDYASALKYFNQYQNVVCIRTLSKAYGLAGLRIGVLIAPEFVIDFFNRVRNPFNVNEFAQVAAIHALQDDDFISKSVENNHRGLDFFYENFRQMKVTYIESQANFVMFDTERDIQLVNELLLRRGVILRPVGNYGFPTHLRLSVGLPEENQVAILALKEVLKEVATKK